jgi:hypothetical protein
MNPFLPGVDERAVYKDAMFFSVHKFIGGIQTPGSCVTVLLLFLCLYVSNGFSTKTSLSTVETEKCDKCNSVTCVARLVIVKVMKCIC